MANNTDKISLKQYSKSDHVWNKHRSDTQSVENILNSDNQKQLIRWGERMHDCSDFLGFHLSASQQGEVKLKLDTTNFCRVRTCPVCQWRRTMKTTAVLLNRLPEFERKYPKYRWLFLTLTVQNCEVTELKKIIQGMNKSFALLKKRKDFKIVKGYIKTIEVTRDKNGLAHPHFHILLFIPPSYFKGKNYISHANWVELWKSVNKFNYDPNVDIRTIKPNAKRETNSLTSAVAEISKYATKPKIFLEFPDWYKIYSVQINRMRFIDSGGILKGILAKNYDEDLINIDEENKQNSTDDILIFDWNRSEKEYLKK